MTNWNDYDDFLKEADRDDRVGDHAFQVQSVTDKTFNNGNAFKDVEGILLTTGNKASADFILTALPTSEEMAQAGSWESGKKKGVAQSINMQKALSTLFDRTPETLKPGDTVGVKCVKNKQGFIRIVAIIPVPKQGAVAQDSNRTPF